MSNGTLKGQCASCGWTTRRTFKNMNRKPCPKCGGQVYVHEEDKNQALVIAIIGLVGMVAIIVLFTVFDVP